MASGEVRWLRERFIPYAMHADVVAGTTPKPDGSRQQNRVEAFDVGTGAAVWRFTGYNIDRNDAFGHPVGDRLVQVNTSNGKLFDQVYHTHLVDIATGRAVLKLDHEDGFDCLYDGQNMIVCHTTSAPAGHSIIGIDATTYKRLWVLDEKTPGRVVPKVGLVYRGLIYVRLKGRAMTLDGRTGEDLDVDLRIVPSYVGPGYALVYEDSGLVLYPAIG